MKKKINLELLKEPLILLEPYRVELKPHQITIGFVKNNFYLILDQVTIKKFYSIIRQAIYNHIQRLPKADLHAHLTGSYPLWYLKSLIVDEVSSQEYQKFIAGVEKLAKKELSYSKAFECFKPIEKLVNTYEKVENGVVAIAQNLIEDGVVYIELRMGLKDLGKGYEEYLLAVLRGIRRAPDGVKINILLSVRRDSPIDLIKLTVDLAIKYRKTGVVGIDISGDATLGDIKSFSSEIKRAKRSFLNIALHLGESIEEIDTPEKQLAQAELVKDIDPDRIGHGVFISEPALSWIIANGKPIEVCPTSSVVFRMLDNHDEHPGLQYYLDHNHPTVCCTDDLVLFDSCLTLELYKLMTHNRINMGEIHHMIKRSFKYAFLPQEMKLAFFQHFVRAFESSNYPLVRASESSNYPRRRPNPRL